MKLHLRLDILLPCIALVIAVALWTGNPLYFIGLVPLIAAGVVLYVLDNRMIDRAARSQYTNGGCGQHTQHQIVPVCTDHSDPIAYAREHCKSPGAQALLDEVERGRERQRLLDSLDDGPGSNGMW